MGLASSTKNPAKKFLNASKNEAKKALSQLVKYYKKQGAKLDYAAKAGNITEEILKFAKQKKISLIVIGSQGRHGFGKLKTLGSTSRKVSELAKCPVLIIR